MARGRILVVVMPWSRANGPQNFLVAIVSHSRRLYSPPKAPCFDDVEEVKHRGEGVYSDLMPSSCAKIIS